MRGMGERKGGMGKGGALLFDIDFVGKRGAHRGEMCTRFESWESGLIGTIILPSQRDSDQHFTMHLRND